MALYRSPVVGTEPYEDSKGPESPTEASPEELKAFYEDMERREVLERKLSKRKSSSGTSIWSRKSLNRSTAAPSVPADLPRIHSHSNLQRQDEHEEAEYSGENLEQNHGPRLASSHSVIADTRENRGWAVGQLPTSKVKYPLHNSLGPRWYKNHHLIPPSQKRPSMRPPTFFSPSFPPMHTSSSPEHVEDSTESSGTYSHSPLPTPTSSQTRVGEGGKPRSRKTSQTTPDTVDLLDVTDPWGTNWHHQSPYDFGQTATADIPNRPRRASMTATQSRHQSVIPSPLSQSTSAVHLHPLQPEIHIPRKLSKRRTTPAVANIFGSRTDDRKQTSAPATPFEHALVTPSHEIMPSELTLLPKRMSVAVPAFPMEHSTPKKEKRGSMLNRIAKKFNLLKKSTDDHVPASDRWHHLESHESKGYVNSPETVVDMSHLPLEKPHRDSVKRIPPPSIENTIERGVELITAEPISREPTVDPDRASLVSHESIFSRGRLTIANPDLSDTIELIMSGDDAPPPPEKPTETAHLITNAHETPPVEMSLRSPSPTLQPLSTDSHLHLNKPLPLAQLATPTVPQLRLSDVQAAQAVEQTLSLSPPSQANFPDVTSTPGPVLEHSPPASPKQFSHPQTDPTPPQNEDKAGSMPDDRSRTLSPLHSPVQLKVLHEKPNRSLSQSRASNMDIHADAEISSQPQPAPVQIPTHDVSLKKTSSQPKPSSSRYVDPPSKSKAHINNSTASTQGSTSGHPSRDTLDRSADASTSTRRPTKQSRSISRSEYLSLTSPVSVPIPFPTGVRDDRKGKQASVEYEGSPLSTSSMLVNPPTPYEHRLSIATDQNPPTLPPKSIYEGKRPQKSSPSNDSPSRQTETFKLVRSLSGHVYASSETITAAGQQWEVVQSIEGKGRKEWPSSRSKDQDHRSRDPEYRSKDQVHKSKDSGRKPKDYEQKVKDERRSRDQESKSKDHRRRSEDEHRARDYERKDFKSKEGQRPTNSERKPKDYEVKSKDEYRSRDYEPQPKEHSHRERDHRRSSTDRVHAPKDRPRDADHNGRLEPTRVSKSKLDVENNDHHRSSHRPSKQAAHYQEESSKRGSSSKNDIHRREERVVHEDKISRQREEYRDRVSDRKYTLDNPSLSNHHHTTSKPQPPPIYVPAQTSNLPSRRLEPITARPTSELPSAAEMNAVRAKESWEMERLWKARSMYGLEPNAATSNVIPGSSSSSSRSDDANTHSAVYGSNHTAYVVQTPFQTGGLNNRIYHSMPSAPPPIIYSSPIPIPSIPESTSSYEPYEYLYRSYPKASLPDYRISPPMPMPRPPLGNPLPDPPREAPLDLKGLTRTTSSNRHSDDYWTKYNGITTAH